MIAHQFTPSPPSHHGFPFSVEKTNSIPKSLLGGEFVQPQACHNTVQITCSTVQIEAYSPGEDRLYVNEKENLYAIFDGHGGDMCSRYVVEKLPKQLLTTLQYQQHNRNIDYPSILKSTFMRIDESFLNEHKSLAKTCPTGSCGVSVLVRNDTLYVCNLGDSRVLLGSMDSVDSWSHKLLTNDHNTNNQNEIELVKRRTTDPFPIRGHVSAKVEGHRVGGVLMVTRAFGDGLFKRRDMSMLPFLPHLPYITSEPEVSVHKITPSDKYVIISSDGLYEYLTAEDVAKYVESQLAIGQDPQKIAHGLIEKQYEVIAKLVNKPADIVKKTPNKKTFMDDTSIIVLVF